jgi:EAL domain-containing protein (putative c-di-GMP-specific phosphodiesterase class I)
VRIGVAKRQCHGMFAGDLPDAIEGPRYFSGNPGTCISVNLSSTDLRSHVLVDWLRRLVTTPGIAPQHIVVEVAEHSFVEPTSAKRIIGKIRDMGLGVAIDDFGTGFSSRSHLTHLSANFLKIEKVFVDAIGTDSVTREVVMLIIGMARSLNLTLISEGVETQEQADFLREQGVTFAQGWLFSKAQPLAALLCLPDADWRTDQVVVADSVPHQPADPASAASWPRTRRHPRAVPADRVHRPAPGARARMTRSGAAGRRLATQPVA